MKKILLILVVWVTTIGHSFAHYLWIETSSSGEVGKAQEIRVFFGEFTYGIQEKVDSEGFKKVSKISLWVSGPSVKKTKLNLLPKEDHYLATFTPSEEGTHTVTLNNNEIDVIDYTKYDFGIFKTHYHSVTRIVVGNKVQETSTDNPEGLAIKNLSANQNKAKLQVFYKGEKLPGNEVKVFVADQWSKTLETDEQGLIAFDLPWETKYVVEVTKKEEVPGIYKGEDYEFVWHCVTYYLNN